MKKKILITLLVCILLSIIVIISKYIIDKIILKNEEKQIKVLKEIYTDFISDCPYYVTFDDSALKNIITQDKLNEDNIKILKSINDTREVIESSSTSAILFSSYNKNTMTITLKLKIINNRQVQTNEHSYKLEVKNFKIQAIPNKLKHIGISDFASQ